MKSILFKPFERFSEQILLIVGVVSLVVGSYMAHLFQVRFDGVLDVHFTPESVSFKQALLENAIDVACLTLFLFIAAKMINEKTRIVDLLATVTVARIPFYLLTLINTSGAVHKATEEITSAVDANNISELPGSSLTILSLVGIVVILILVWHVALLFNGFKTASNAKGTNHIIYFAVAILIAEVVSKMLIFQYI